MVTDTPGPVPEPRRATAPRADGERPARKRRYALIWWMARALGIDLSAAFRDGAVSADAIRRMEHHCGACSEEVDCKRRMAAFARTRRAEAELPPRYCANRQLLLYLIAKKKAD